MRNIMIVDPCPNDYADLVAASAHLDTMFYFATTAEEGLRTAQAVRPAVWLINLNLPDMSGHDLHSELKQQDPTPRVWLIADHYRTADELRAREAGVSAFVCKPIRGFAAPASFEQLFPADRLRRAGRSLAACQGFSKSLGEFRPSRLRLNE